MVRLHSDYPLRFRAWKSLRNRTLLGALRAFYAEWKPDVVHSHLVHTHLSYAALTEARAAGAGVVFTAHDSMTYCYQKLDCFHGGAAHDYELRDYRAQWQKCLPCQRFRYRPGRNAAIAAVLARDVDRFTVVSDELGNAVRANGIRVDRTIHNALRLQQDLPSAQAVAAFRAKFKLEGKRLIALGGRLHVLKGVVQLFQMLSVLRDEFPSCACWCWARRTSTGASSRPRRKRSTSTISLCPRVGSTARSWPRPTRRSTSWCRPRSAWRLSD